MLDASINNASSTIAIFLFLDELVNVNPIKNYYFLLLDELAIQFMVTQLGSL